MTEITCRTCFTKVYRLKEPIEEGDPISASQFEGINGFPDPEDGQERRCPNCNDDTGLALGMMYDTGHDIAV